MEAIHKINIMAEAKFDIAECVGLTAFDWRTLKAETEEYITRQAQAGRIPWWGYFRADYIDGDSGRRLKLFFYRGQTFGLMQTWDLKGVCEAGDWSEDTEDCGQIRAWLETKIEDMPDVRDWAVRARVYETLQNTEKTLWVNVLEEVKNAFECERDKETAEEVALLQSVYFEFGGGRTVKKSKRRRKSG